MLVAGRCGHNQDQQWAKRYSFPRCSSLVLTIRTMFIIGQGKVIVETKIRLSQVEQLLKKPLN